MLMIGDSILGFAIDYRNKKIFFTLIIKLSLIALN